MTIMNLHIERDLAILASNTDTVMVKGSEHQPGPPSCKVLALADKSCVLSGRGVVGLIFNVYAWAQSSTLNFDGLADDLEPAVTAIASHTLNELSAFGGVPSVSDHELLGEMILVGWSRSRDSMAAFHVAVSYAGAVAVNGIDGAVVPWIWGDHPKTQGTVESMTELAMRQSGLAEKHVPGKAWRGDLTLASITRDSINFTTVREFWKAPAHDADATRADSSLEHA